MQVKKEEIREAIIRIAEIEFANKGFKVASMRTIARKANTTIGNVYNYFSSKEELLDVIIGDTVKHIENLFNNHVEENIRIYDFETLNKEIVKCDIEKLGYSIFLSKKFIILMEGSEGTKYETYREEFLKKCKDHFLWHLNKKEDKGNFIEIVANAFVNGILFIAKRNDDIAKAKGDFIKLYQLICSGMVSQFNVRGEFNDRN